MPSTYNPDTGLILSTVRITGKFVSNSPLLQLEVEDGTNHLPLNCKRKKNDISCFESKQTPSNQTKVT